MINTYDHGRHSVYSEKNSKHEELRDEVQEFHPTDDVRQLV